MASQKSNQRQRAKNLNTQQVIAQEQEAEIVEVVESAGKLAEQQATASGNIIEEIEDTLASAVIPAKPESEQPALASVQAHVVGYKVLRNFILTEENGLAREYFEGETYSLKNIEESLIEALIRERHIQAV